LGLFGARRLGYARGAMTEILQAALPFAPWADPRTRRLPGILPLEPGDWLRVDDAYAAQMAERDRLIAEVPEKVHALDERGRPAAEELLARVLVEVAGLAGFAVRDGEVTRPDGVTVRLDRSAPLVTLGHLVQEDFCILEKGLGEDEHVLTGAILCFPANWTLAQKFLRPLFRIHKPVTPYDADVARRVQRLFDAIRPEQGLWRANANHCADATLFSPRREEDPPRQDRGADTPFLRSERQTLVRLPESRAVIFGIHTYIVRRESLTPEQAEALERFPLPGDEG
jgi:hypothetical protein